jgi:hypothetical protein
VLNLAAVAVAEENGDNIPGRPDVRIQSKKTEAVSEWERANQSNLRVESPVRCPLRGATHYVPGGNGAAGARDIDEAPKG